MTDERIKEELGNIVSAYMRNPFGEKIDSVLLPYIRAAERLAKIEVLEKVVKKLAIQDTPVPVGSNFSDYMHGACDNVGESMRLVNTMIAELKEEGE